MKRQTIRRLILSTSVAPAKVPVTKEQHDFFYRGIPSATRNKTTTDACVRTASSGSATVTVSVANTMQATPSHWTFRTQMEMAICTTICRTTTLQSGNSFLTAYYWNRLFARLRELDPEADTIIQLWMDHPEGISDRAIARELGRPQKTFAPDQMKKYRTDLRKIRNGK